MANASVVVLNMRIAWQVWALSRLDFSSMMNTGSDLEWGNEVWGNWMKKSVGGYARMITIVSLLLENDSTLAEGASVITSLYIGAPLYEALDLIGSKMYSISPSPGREFFSGLPADIRNTPAAWGLSMLVKAFVDSGPHGGPLDGMSHGEIMHAIVGPSGMDGLLSYDCGDVFIRPSGFVTAPMGPADCTWVIMTGDIYPAEGDRMMPEPPRSREMPETRASKVREALKGAAAKNPKTAEHGSKKLPTPSRHMISQRTADKVRGRGGQAREVVCELALGRCPKAALGRRRQKMTFNLF